MTIVLGGGLAMAAPAAAAPDDAIAMPDDALRACINADLGQGATDPITQTQAASITKVECRAAGITDITGLESMGQLETVWLDNNPGIVSRAPLMNLHELGNVSLWNAGVTDADLSALSDAPKLHHLNMVGNDLVDIRGLADASSSLTSLYLGSNAIADLSPLAQLSGLTHLQLANNQIADVSALKDLTGLLRLHLGSNAINDVSPLSALTNLEVADAGAQSLALPTVPLGSETDNPVTGLNGDPVPPTSSDAGFGYDSATDTWSFSTRGSMTLTWNAPASIGSSTELAFSGTITQRITFARAAPESPDVTPAICRNGEIVDPQITLPDTEGITYAIIGEVAAGETVTITAVPADDDHAIYVDPASDWIDASGDHIYATLEITLTVPDCDTVPLIVIDPPNGDLPIDDPCGPDNATWMLPAAEDMPEGFTWSVTEDGMLIAVANDGYQFSDAGDLDPMIREYGYAPDSGVICPVNPEDPEDDPETPEPPQTETDAPELARTGETSPVMGAVLGALLLSGGALLMTRRSRREA